MELSVLIESLQRRSPTTFTLMNFPDKIKDLLDGPTLINSLERTASEAIDNFKQGDYRIFDEALDWVNYTMKESMLPLVKAMHETGRG